MGQLACRKTTQQKQKEARASPNRHKLTHLFPNSIVAMGQFIKVRGNIAKRISV